MHRVRRFDDTQVRDMRRTTIAGDAMTVRKRPDRKQPEDPHGRQPALEASSGRLDLGRLRARRPARPAQSGDPGEGAAGHRRGEGGKNLLPVAAARLSRRQRHQPAPQAAGADADRAQRQAQHDLPAALRRSHRARRGVRRPGAADAAILDPVGQPRACRPDVRRRRRRQAGGRVLQRLPRRQRHRRPGDLRRRGQPDAQRTGQPARASWAWRTWRRPACRAAP